VPVVRVLVEEDADREKHGRFGGSSHAGKTANEGVARHDDLLLAWW
jgi:hypothetical protein